MKANIIKKPKRRKNEKEEKSELYWKKSKKTIAKLKHP